MATIKISATEAKLRFGSLIEKVKGGTPIIIQKNNDPQIVLISLDEYEDFLEQNDQQFQKEIQESKNQIISGNFGTLDDLYKIHQETIRKEAQ